MVARAIRTGLLFISSCLIIQARLRGQCVSQLRPPANSGNTTGLVVDSPFPSDFGDVLGAAEGMWNTDCGNDGSAFPYFVTGGSGVSRVLTVSYGGDSPLFDKCVSLDGNTISIYENFPHHPPNNPNATVYYPCGNGPDIYAQTLTHELGHSLYLNDSSCDGYIMDGIRYDAGTNIYNQRTVQPDECGEADYLNYVPGETGSSCSSKNCQCPPDDTTCQGSPLVLDLGSGEYQLSGPDDPVRFDINGDGHRFAITWTARSSRVAFLWLDRNGDGFVNSGAELFGNHTALPDGELAANGFEALRPYDVNGDGVIDAADPIWSELMLWIDLNHDGLAERSELFPVAGSPIVAIDLNYHWIGRRDGYGNSYRYEGSFRFRNSHGQVVPRRMYDVFFVRLQ